MIGARRPQIDLADAEIGVVGLVGDLGQRRALVGHHAHDLEAGERVGLVGQGPDQRLGFAAGRSDEHPLPRMDALNGLLGTPPLFKIVVRPIE